VTELTTSPAPRRRLILGMAAALIALVVVEATSYVGLRLAPRLLQEPIRRTPDIFAEQSAKLRQLLDTTAAHREVLDSALGWRYRAGFRKGGDQISAQGLRSDRLYASTPPTGVLRVAAFGDSYVYGTEVDNAGAWPTLLERLAPGIEVMNYGVGGYGVDQAYLRYVDEGTRLQPHVVVIGFAPVDLPRVVNRYRRFLDDREIALTKPRFVVGTNGALSLIPNPLPSRRDYARLVANPELALAMSDSDQWFEPAVYKNPLYDWSATARLVSALWVKVHRRYVGDERVLRGRLMNARSPAFRVQMALFEEFAARVKRDGAIPLIAILPDHDAIVEAARGMERPFAPILAELRRRHVDYVDLTDAFLADADVHHAERWFMPGGHYSGAGNRVVATRLAREVRARAEVSDNGPVATR
jgi:lysophospholipase L1-like esterase